MKPFLQEVAEDLVEKFGNNLQNCAIIFNNKRPAAYLQKHLADIYQKAFWSPSFFTIQEFFAKFTNYKIADFYTQFFTLHQLYNEALTKEEPNFKAIEPAKFFPIAKTILSDFSQIDNDLVDYKQLFQELEDIAQISYEFDHLTDEQHKYLSQFWNSYSKGKHLNQQKNFIKMWRRMPVLYERFHKKLKENNYITLGMAYRNMANNLADNEEYLENFNNGKLIFVGFNALSQAEAKVFKRWQNQEKAIFYFDTDTYYLNDPLQEAGLFLRKNFDKFELINELNNERSFIKQKDKTVNVYKVQGQNAQAKILNEIVKDDYAKALNEDETSQTVIVLADESLLLSTLQTIPSTVEDFKGENLINGQKIDVNITMGMSLGNTSIFGLADLWLNMQKYLQKNRPKAEDKDQNITIGYKEVETFLSHPLTGISEKKRNDIETVFIKEQLLNVSLERLQRQMGLFELFFKRVEKPIDVVLQLIEILKLVLQRQLSKKTLKKIEAELFLRAIKELNQLYNNLKKHVQKQYNLEIDEQFNDFKSDILFNISLTQKTIQSISVPLEGDPLNGIQVMGLLETRNLNFENVIVLGLNEGIIPKTSIAATLIPDSLRRVYGLPVLENLDAISAYMLYRLVQRAENIHFVYNSLTDESNSGEPSRFLKQLEYESGYNFKYHELDLAIKTEEPITFKIEKTPEVMAILQKYLNGNYKLSASALTTYISNPIDFYYKYVAFIKEPEEVTEVVEANTIGSALHLALEKFYGSLKAQNPNITAARISEKRKELPQIIKESFIDILYYDKIKEQQNLIKNYNRDITGMQNVVLSIIEKYANIILDYDEDIAPFKILDLEYKDIIAFHFLDYQDKEQKINVLGIFDRIDEKDNNIRIVDYKTGSDELKYKDMPSTFDTDGKYINKALLQTLLYTYIYEQTKKIENVEPNLYVIKKMTQKQGVHFISKKEPLKGEKLIEEKEEYLTFLRGKLKELFNPEIPFEISKNPENYPYSIYTTLMGL